MADPYEEILRLAERSFIRSEAKDLLDQCLEQYDISMFNDLLESLVLQGSSSIAVLQEIMDEVRAAKSELGAQNIGARLELLDALTHLGVEVPETLPSDMSETLLLITSRQYRRVVLKPDSRPTSDDAPLLRDICVHASERMLHISHQIGLLNEIEAAIEDWLDGLAYQAAHERDFTDDRHPGPYLQ